MRDGEVSRAPHAQHGTSWSTPLFTLHPKGQGFVARPFQKLSLTRTHPLSSGAVKPLPEASYGGFVGYYVCLCVGDKGDPE